MRNGGIHFNASLRLLKWFGISECITQSNRFYTFHVCHRVVQRQITAQRGAEQVHLPPASERGQKNDVGESAVAVCSSSRRRSSLVPS